MTYETRENEIATEMAKAKEEQVRNHPDLRHMPVLWEFQPEHERKEKIDAMLPLAAIALKHCAEAFRAGYCQLGIDEVTKFGEDDKPYQIPSTEQHCITQGYTPKRTG